MKTKIKRIIILVIILIFGISQNFLLGKEKEKKEEKPVYIGKEKIVVTATKTPHSLKDVPITTVIITREEIEKTNAQTVGDILRWLPGVYIQTNGFSRATVKIHGLPSKYTLVLVDGQRLKGRHAESIDLSHIPIDMIDRIEIIKGPSSVLYGSDAVAGVINIITKSAPKKSTFDGYVSYGTGNTVRAMLGYGSQIGKFRYLITGSKNKSNNMGAGYEYDGYNVQGKFEYNFNESNKVTFTTGYFNEKGDYLDDEKFNLILNWRIGIDKVSYLEVKGFHYDSHRLDARPGRAPRTWDEKTTRAEVQYVRMLGKSNLLTLGLESRYDEIKYTLIEGKKHQIINSLFAQDEIKLIKPLTLILAFRLDNHDKWGTELVPKAAIFFKLSETTNLRASIGKGFLAPTLSQLYEQQYYHPWGGGFWLGGNPDLKPETSTGYTFDIEHYFTSNFTTRISLFKNNLRNMITSERTDEIIDGKPVFRSININKAYSQGIELEVKINLNKAFVGVLGYTFLKTQNISSGKEFPYSPRHTFNFVLNYSNQKIGLNFNILGKYLGKRFTNTSNTQSIDECYLVDIKIIKKIYRDTGFFIAVDNLFNEKIEKESKYFRQGRTFTAGMRMHF
ncbi:TonB-dependent receptor [Candidatus Aminicenantes bacterium AC-335-A11]|nr:TonB-dependent receptor [SCandidatus Aminicenantes bacterium Aminicenantia_JdfR_composite]MCP2596296.1 TonB-dependent receptor [Candidatus Aminicenantes bacterium AC-335-G13]MCP2597871.1 TonB-dependent receptor [Candidatus Aminicenantes bacterium AC-335-L06]MCP2606535.1 TonB-dependent receptor [Candidatus Aminicenantes bacterium AC-708-I09]MCP2618131.1 TonB-dependent receptor [Candidatus Aminicenantes bacterium AC-335-A11]MCP2620472.1 TonB-dependent receptor [Candidatus Aminicenantes bacter